MGVYKPHMGNCDIAVPTRTKILCLASRRRVRAWLDILVADESFRYISGRDVALLSSREMFSCA
jgi:hypothetical protein